MPKFKMKPRVIEAIQWMGDNHYEVKQEGEFIAIDQEDFEATYMHYE